LSPILRVFWRAYLTEKASINGNLRNHFAEKFTCRVFNFKFADLLFFIDGLEECKKKIIN